MHRSIGCQKECVNMYDILVKSDIDKDIEEQVKPLIGDEFERLSIVPVQKQSNGSNCSVFSIKYQYPMS